MKCTLFKPPENVIALHCCELVISFFIVTPCVVGFWRGIWTLLDIYLLQENVILSSWLSVLIGLGIIILQNLMQNIHRKYFSFKSWNWHIYSRCYVCVQAFAVVNHWRGIWALWDIYTTTSLTSSLVSTSVGSIVVWLFRSSKNIPAQPTVIKRDHDAAVFQYTTRFEVNSKTMSIKFILDMLLTYIVIHSFVVTYWRGVWVLMDNILFPDNLKYSTWASGILGYVCMFIIYILQFLAANLSNKIREKTHWILQLIFEDAFIYIAGFSVVNIWRGVWYVYDYYILPNNLSVSCWITVVFGVFTLFAIQAGRSLGAIECLVDGIPSDGSGLYFYHYFNVLNAPLDRPDVVTKDEVKLKTSNVATQTPEINQFVEIEINQNKIVNNTQYPDFEVCYEG